MAALPAVWTDKRPQGVAQGLGDALLTMLELDLAYVRLSGAAGGDAVEAVSADCTAALDAAAVGTALGPYLEASRGGRPATAPNPIAGGELRLAVLPIGHATRFGLAAAGSRRPDFPSEFERLLFGVAVNHAAGALENAALFGALREADRARQELLNRERAARQEAETAERRFRDLIHGLDAIVWEAHAEPFRFTFVSERVGAILGYSRERFYADSELWTALVHPDDHSRVADARRRVAAEGRQSAYEYRGITADGRTVWLHDIIYVNDSAAGQRQLRGITVDVTGRKRTEEALRQTEQQFALFMRYLPGAAWMKDLDGRYVYANETAEQLFDTPLSELRGKTDSEVFDSVTAEAFQQNDRAALAAGKCLQTIEALRQPDGLHHSVVSKFPIFDAKGAAVLVGGIAVDITERRRAEEALQKSERRFRALIENSTDAIALVLPGARVLYASPSTVRVLGYTPEEMAGINAFDVVYPDDLPLVHGTLQELLARPGESLTAQVRIRHKDGSYRWIEALATNLLADPDIGAIVANYRDITERKRFDEELRQSELRYSTLAEAIPGVLFTNLPDGWSDYTSRRFYEYTGMPPGSAEGFGWMEALHPEDAEPAQALWKECLRDGKPFEMQYRLRRADGSYRWFAVRSVPMRGAGGRILRWFGVCMDIDDQKRAEEALRQAQKLESIGLLAGGIAHDFNNLLVGVLGNASLAMDFVDRTSPAVQMLDEVVRASQQAASLTRQLLAYAGKGQIVVERVSMSELIRDVHPLIRTTIANAELRLELAPGLPPVEVDVGQLQQLAMNLIINAAEAIGETTPGTVTVRTGIREFSSGRLRENLEGRELAPGTYVWLEVQDTGCGMDQDTLRRIFDPFFTTKFTGRGLGLAAVSGILRAHRGAIEVQSRPGEGSRFTIYLPAAEGPPARQAASDAREPGPAGAGIVLVVDDEEVVRKVAARMLNRLGYEAWSATSGAEAVTRFAEAAAEISAVLLDLTMPGMNGLETLRRLKALRRDVPVILSSGYTEIDAKRRFEGEDLAGFIQKPYTSAQLADKLTRVLKP
jgi:PAS domain S-box-containing protein